MNDKTNFLTLPDRRLAYQHINAATNKDSSIMFLGGYGSDMMGTKAEYLAAQCTESGLGFIRFDYRGHGQSSGAFIDGTIGDWYEDALAVFDQCTTGRQILVGSSMGGWIGLMLAKARPDRVAGFIGVAAAPDFTEELILPILTTAQRETLEHDGVLYNENDPADFRLPLTWKLVQEARNDLLLSQPLPLAMPVHLLHGQKDAEVPWKYALRIADHLEGENVRVTMVKDGDHRLSRAQDLALLWQVISFLG